MNVPASLHPGDLAGKLYEDGRDQLAWFLAVQATSVPPKPHQMIILWEAQDEPTAGTLAQRGKTSLMGETQILDQEWVRPGIEGGG